MTGHDPAGAPVALVTGSTGGIGRAVAARLARDGLRVVVHSRNQSRAQEAADSVGASAALAADLTDPVAAARLVDTAAERFGRLDVLVNNAGIPMTGPSETLPLEDWDRAICTNLTAPFACAQTAARHMLAAGSGVIVNVTSVLAHVGIPQRAAYAAAKHGLLGLTRVLAVEWAGRGVRVVSVDPGYIGTELIRQTQVSAGYTLADLERRTPLGRVGTPEEVADVVAFATRATYITGSSMVVDGGWLAYGGW